MKHLESRMILLQGHLFLHIDKKEYIEAEIYVAFKIESYLIICLQIKRLRDSENNKCLFASDDSYPTLHFNLNQSMYHESNWQQSFA